jgi:hypothetical protein
MTNPAQNRRENSSSFLFALSVLEEELKITTIMEHISSLLSLLVWNISTGAFVSGILLHQTFLRHGEWHRCALDMVLAYLVLTAILLLPPASFGHLIHVPPITPGLVIKLNMYHFCGLFCSMTLYRAVFHPLHSFPGPFLARVSSFYKVNLSRNLRLFEETYKLHQKYGDLVRIGKLKIANNEGNVKNNQALRRSF